MFESDPEHASKEAHSKWKDLGPLDLEDVIKHGDEQLILQDVGFSRSPSDPSVVGQLQKSDDEDGDMLCTGLGRETDAGIYEGQYLDDEWNGFGRRIISNGDYYIGFWKEGMRNGWGRYVYNKKTAKNLIQVEEGEWLEDEFKG